METNMNDLISRSALLNGGIRVEYGYNDDGRLLIPMRDVMESIKNAPSIDAAPVVHAKWVENDLCEHRCTNCGNRIPFYHCYSGDYYYEWDEEIDLTKFCPNCGAMMDAE